MIVRRANADDLGAIADLDWRALHEPFMTGPRRDERREALMAVWSDDEEIICVHPGGPRIVGAAAIRATFDSIFANGPITVHPEKLRAVNTGHCAVHNVLERVDISTDEGQSTAWVIATNVYVRTDHGWRLAAHHASPGSPRELQEVAEAPSILH